MRPAKMQITSLQLKTLFGVLSLLMLFLLCAVYLSDTDALLSAFLRVI